ncbi:BREX-1 system adenine-specific DNA-methyltransferase PglX [Vagococcus lutrae]|uniref:BREX-1 system adenine-specific DNA-methyltransferase PglX n=1 Tax=Vagococcus lutrae TaxID=81947 RepID=UPI000F868F30|nr:BREX-1 system adenine-specific DNA-methyltransferase PglX [Vagococcus lutrae]RST92253.1 SAM-dependent methyltransferase [Vagococcus lutrae]
MNQGKLKTFAVEARRELLEKVALQARKIGVTKDSIKDASVESSDALIINGQHLSKEERVQRNKLIRRIDETSFEQVMEEAAYTWFNRFVALRFMEVNDYLPTRVRVLSSLDGGIEPDMMKEALSLGLDIDNEKVYEMKLNNHDDELFKYLIIAHCNDLNDYLPFMFGTIEDYTEILFPEGLLNTDSFVRKMTNTEVFPEEDWYEVEIIGWLYQYYISEENERLISAKKAYKPDEIPAVTQLFTPEWIVRYMVQNTIGKQWVEAHPEDRDLIDNWEYYLENTNPSVEEQEELDKLVDSELKVEDLKCIDPAMGSGHILVYMFEVLREIYIKQGYTNLEIPRLIIENNLYGLDIDERAYQLAAFSVVMKGMKFNNGLLRDIERNGLKLNLVAIEGTSDFTKEDIQFLAGENEGNSYDKVHTFIKKFEYAKEIGSLLIIEDFDAIFLEERLKKIRNSELNLLEIGIYDKVVDRFETLVKQSKILSNTYDIYITNPPYLARKYQTSATKKYLARHYDNVKTDLFSSFIISSISFTKENGHVGFMSPFVWMFISSHEKLRTKLIADSTISSLIQLEYSGFEGATVPICTFTLRNNTKVIPGEYIRLSDFVGAKQQPIKAKEAIENPNVTYRYTFNQKNFKKLPGSPVAYWATEEAVKVFNNSPIGSDFPVKKGSDTGNNDLYLRHWYEVNFEDVGLYLRRGEDTIENNKKWVPYDKGGDFRRWYGNNSMLILWENDGKILKKTKANLRSKYLFFKDHITWNALTSSVTSARYSDYGALFDSAGSSMFPKKIHLYLAFMNSIVASKLLEYLNPTLNYGAGTVSKLPVVILNNSTEEKVEEMSLENVELSMEDWNSVETSWNFKELHLLKYQKKSLLIEDSYNIWIKITDDSFKQLKENEEELNRIFIDIYGLQDELTAEVSPRDVTITKIYNETKDIPEEIKGNQYVLTKKDVIQQFISYAVGCMFGRYSLDEEGLVYAGGEFDASRYETYSVVEDNIIPITSDVFLEDDLVNRFIEFVETVYGKETLEENLNFIAEALGQKKNESSRDTIHNYFLKDFFKDHAKMYSVTGSGRRPIYWKFTSGRENAFNCFIYMHRYDKTTISRIRTEYLHDVQQRLETRKIDLDQILNSDASTTELNRARKEMKTVEKQLAELVAYDEKLRHMADQQIEIDLDDGFKVNYPKFKGLVEKV